jgi:mannose-binding lectin 1
LKDVLASSITSQDARFADLHNRLQTLGSTVDNIFRENVRRSNLADGQHQELLAALATQDQVRTLESRLQSMEASIAELRREIGAKDYTGQFNDLHAGLKVRHDALLQQLPEKMTHGMTLFSA